MRIIRGLEHHSYKDSLRVEADKRRLYRDLIATFQYLEKALNNDRQRLYQAV